MKNKIIQGDCIEEMKKLEDKSVDTIITDPPYGLGFMGKEWDSYSDNEALQEWTKKWSKEVLRIAKPGTIMLCFGGTRTFHRIACGIEDAGWEIRDTLMWIYGKGFPKSHNIGKAVDKKQGNEREKVGEKEVPDMTSGNYGQGKRDYTDKKYKITKGNSDWEGYGTALKPAYEPIILAMKPKDGTYAENALKHDVGGLNIDGCRIPFEDTQNPATNPKYRKEAGYKLPARGQKSEGSVQFSSSKNETNTKGRFPANLIHDGIDLDGKERYFYCAKASKSERNKGLEDRQEKTVDDGRDKPIDNPYQRGKTPKKNNHPTVKPLALMGYLVELTKMPNEDQIYLDPFVGSGTTAMAVKKHNRNYIGIEQKQEYIEIARARIKAIQNSLI